VSHKGSFRNSAEAPEFDLDCGIDVITERGKGTYRY
jgi:hypothetical protein